MAQHGTPRSPARRSYGIDEPAITSRAIGFRYQNPDFRHFCLLRAARIVSALNATVELAIAGFPQEIGILHRTIHEFSSHIDAVMVQVERSGGVNGELAAFIKDFFEDSRRGIGPNKRKILSQKYVNELIGSRLDEARDHNPADLNWRPAAHLHQNLAFIFSNYVHGRYPETMDLYGGTHGRFHVGGMKGTPKDLENVVMVDSLITTASRCFIGLVQGLRLQSLISDDQMLRGWYNRLGD